MDTAELIAGYEAVCDELRIAATSREALLRELAGMNLARDYPLDVRTVEMARTQQGRSDVLLTQIAESGARTIGFIAADWRGGCPECFSRRLTALDHYYGSERAAPLEADNAAALVALFSRLHGIALAMTEASEDQNWSVLMPVPGCPICSDVLRTPEHLDRYGAAIWPTEVSSVVGSAKPSDSGGMRDMSAADFVALNRFAIGFGSVVGNPVSSAEESASFLVNGPVVMGTRPDHDEVAGGKGLFKDQAMASFLGEALERYALAGTYRAASTIGSYEELRHLAVDPSAEFGLPALDTNPSIRPYLPSLPIEWVTAEEVTGDAEALVPANFVYCPYIPRDGAATISTGSTNGAAAGYTVADATRQGLLEIIERDAFWYYARTGREPLSVPSEMIPDSVQALMALKRGTFRVQLLVNPFHLPVVQVTFVSDQQGGARTARGTGVSGDLETSIRRAFSECIQMYDSLSTGQAVEIVPTDMRNLWHSGKSIAAFRNFFTDELVAVSQSELQIKSDVSVQSLVAAAEQQGLRTWRVRLLDTSSFAVVKVIVSKLAVMDATYFQTNDRLSDFAAAVGHPKMHEVQYPASLFM